MSSILEREVGSEVAEAFQAAWEAIEPEIISQACYFLEQKQIQMRSGASEEDAIASAKAKLSEDIVDHLESLVPQIFRRGV